MVAMAGVLCLNTYLSKHGIALMLFISMLRLHDMNMTVQT